MNDGIRIVEVGPRDGLQNEKTPIPTEVKLRFIERLIASGLTEIEVTSFVSPKWVPQLADADEIVALLPLGPKYSFLVPNSKGLVRTYAAGLNRIAVFTAASDAFTQHNINMTVDQSLEVFGSIVAELELVSPDRWVRGYVSTAFECPYSGRVESAAVCRVVERLLTIGVDEISIGDTIGAASPSEVRRLIKDLTSLTTMANLNCHFHDTRGTGIANVMAALDLGIRSFDASAGGLGGCPYAPGASGNIATEDLVYLLEREGIPTGIDLDALSKASLEILELLGRHPVANSQIAQLSASGTFPT